MEFISISHSAITHIIDDNVYHYSFDNLSFDIPGVKHHRIDRNDLIIDSNDEIIQSIHSRSIMALNAFKLILEIIIDIPNTKVVIHECDDMLKYLLYTSSFDMICIPYVSYSFNTLIENDIIKNDEFIKYYTDNYFDYANYYDEINPLIVSYINCLDLLSRNIPDFI